MKFSDADDWARAALAEIAQRDGVTTERAVVRAVGLAHFLTRVGSRYDIVLRARDTGEEVRLILHGRREADGHR